MSALVPQASVKSAARPNCCRERDDRKSAFHHDPGMGTLRRLTKNLRMASRDDGV
jgi:hypothetical protein